MKKTIEKNGHKYVLSKNNRYYRVEFIGFLKVMLFVLGFVFVVAFIVAASEIPGIKLNSEYTILIAVKTAVCIIVAGFAACGIERIWEYL